VQVPANGGQGGDDDQLERTLGVFATTWTKAATLSARVESEENAEERAKRIALELSATTRKRRRSKRTSSMSSRKEKSRKEKREEEEKKFDETPR